MYKRRLFLLVLVLLLSMAGTASASTMAYYFIDPHYEADFLVNFFMIYNLLGHFDKELHCANVNNYQPGGMAKYDFVVFYATSIDPLPDTFLADVARNKKRVLWIGAGLSRLARHLDGPGPFGFTSSARPQSGHEWDQIRYKGRVISRISRRNFYAVKMTGAAHVYSFLASSAGDRTLPHFVCGGNLCFLAEDPLVDVVADDSYLVFADLLHEFYRTGAPEQKLAMIRLEDIAPVVTNAELLVKYADRLHEMGIPFSFGVTPIFADPEGRYFPRGTEHRFRNSPELVATINHLRQLGGTMIMHGVTHQHGSGISRVDWEFSRGVTHEPVPEDSAAWARERLDRGLAEFAGQGWRPRIWETPHYSASWGDYLTFADYFRVCQDRLLVFPVPPDAPPIFARNLHPRSQMAPYFLKTSTQHMAVLPETLSFIDLTSADPAMQPQGKLDYADRLSVIRDGVASIFIHFEFVPFDQLKTLLDGLKQRGYTFVGPEHFVGPLDDRSGG